jgi:hypothetical protein
MLGKVLNHLVNALNELNNGNFSKAADEFKRRGTALKTESLPVMMRCPGDRQQRALKKTATDKK